MFKPGIVGTEHEISKARLKKNNLQEIADIVFSEANIRYVEIRSLFYDII